MPVVEPDIHAPTRNPLDEERSAGGSAAAVAGGLLPVAHASDGAGSIRIPAAFCGLVGHKATRDLLPNPYRRMEAFGLATCGALTRTVEDAAAMLDVLVRRRPGAEGSFLAAARRPPRRLRMRFTTNPPVGATAPEIAAAVRGVDRTLAALGHDVAEIRPLSGSVSEFLPLYQRMAADPPVLREALLQPLTRWLRAEGRLRTRTEACQVRDALAARTLGWFADADVMLTPTVPVPPPPIGAFCGLPPAEAFHRAAVLGAFTAMCNVTGQPAVSVPVAQAHGLSIGAQLIGRVREDATVLALARQFEKAR